MDWQKTQRQRLPRQWRLQVMAWLLSGGCPLCNITVSPVMIYLEIFDCCSAIWLH